LPVDVVLNPKARGLRDGSRLREGILDAAARRGARVHTTRSLDELEGAAGRIAADGTSGVVIAGGDGSHMSALSALARAFPSALPPVGLAPCGTVSTIARNLGAKGGARAFATRLLDAACSGTARASRQPTLRVRDDGGGDRVGFMFGAGLVARFFDVYYSEPRQGRMTAARIAGEVFAGSFVGAQIARKVLSPVAARVSVDGADAPGQTWTLLVASVLRDVGLHLLVTYRAGKDEGAFHAVGSALPAGRLGPQLPRVLAGKPLRGPGGIDALVRSFAVRFDAPDHYVLDGDVFPARSVAVTLGPRLTVLLPP